MVRQAELFTLDGLPNWLPEETLFSLCSRYHVLTGASRSEDTCRLLFGHSRRGLAHDLPSQIDEFARRTQLQLGSAEQIARNKTILSYYLPLRSLDDELDALAAMRGQGIGSLKFRLGLLTSKFGASHPLKACPLCMQADTQSYGTTYWHLQHQYPGVWYCNTHECQLLYTTAKTNGEERFNWLLPHGTHLQPTETFSDTASQHQSLSGLKISKISAALANLTSGFRFAPQALLDTYRGELIERGFASRSGSLRHDRIGQSYFNNILPLAGIANMFAMPTTPSQAAAQVLRILRPSRSGTHPFRHVLVIYWLFESWEKFWSKYIAALSNAAAGIVLPCPVKTSPTHTDAKENEIYRLVTSEAYSCRKAADLVGVDIATAASWLAKKGIAITRRPKKLKASQRNELVADLARGAEKLAVAQKYGLSISTITKVLFSEVGLHAQWCASRHEAARQKARNEWLKAKRENPFQSVKQLREEIPQAYAWLYRNDRSWLVSENADLPKGLRQRGSNVDWAERDQLLRQRILALRMREPGISLQQICRKIPELKAKLVALDNLPLTEQALTEMIKISTEFSLDG